jgi:Cu/Zn superoxide dismutase
VYEHHKGDIGNLLLMLWEWNHYFDYRGMEYRLRRSNKRYSGKGLIVHEGTDDFVSQPSGNMEQE